MNILQIEILTNDLVKTENFYSNILELKTINKKENSISFIAGSSILTFAKSHKLNPTYHFAFNIPHNKLDEAIKWAATKFELIRIDANEIIANFESWNAKAIYFYDNNKNILEFIARFDLDNASDKPFDSSSVLSISEIGIVTDEPIKLTDKLIEENHVSLFTKGTKSEKFVTLGNDEGLFIIVETNRNWYPTQQPAEKNFMKIKIDINGLTREISIN